MDPFQITLQDWRFEHLCTDEKQTVPRSYAQFPHYLRFLTRIENIVLRVQGWWPLWYPLLYQYDVTVQAVPEDEAALKRCALFRGRRTFRHLPFTDSFSPSLNSSEPSLGTSTPIGTVFLVSCRIQERPITPISFTEVVDLLCNRFLKEETDHPEWGKEIRNTIQRHPWYRRHAHATSREKEGEKEEDSRVLRWTTFLHVVDEKIRQARKTAEGQEERRDITWARACLVCRENLDYLCVSNYPELLDYLPMNKIAIFPSDLLRTLHRRVTKSRGEAFFRLFYGVCYQDTFLKLANARCFCVHTRQEAKEAAEKEEGDLDEQVQDRRPNTWKGDALVTRHYWVQIHGKRRHGSDSTSQSCECESFRERSPQSGSHLTPFEMEAPLIRAVFASLPEKMQHMQSACLDLIRRTEEEKEEEKKGEPDMQEEKEEEKEKEVEDSLQEKARDIRLSMLLQQYHIRLDLGEMLALQYGSVDRLGDLVHAQRDPIELGWELQRICFYTCLLVDAKMANGHTMTRLHVCDKDQVLDEQGQICTRPTLTIDWHRLGQKNVAQAVETARQRWQTCWTTGDTMKRDWEVQTPEEKRRYTHLFFTQRYASGAWSPQDLTLDDLSLFSILFSMLGKVPRTSYIRPTLPSRPHLPITNEPLVERMEDLSDGDFLASLSRMTDQETQTLGSNKQKKRKRVDQENKDEDDADFLNRLLDTDGEAPMDVFPTREAKETSMLEPLVFQRQDHTRLIRDLVKKGYLWFQPSVQEKKQGIPLEESSKPHGPSPYHLFLHHTLFQVSAAHILLLKWHRHVRVTSPLAFGLSHVHDLSRACQQRYFSEYLEARQALDCMLDSTERNQTWEAYRSIHLRSGVKVPSFRKNQDKKQFQQAWMTHYQDWAPPLVMNHYNPLCLRPTDTKYESQASLPEYPPQDGSVQRITLAYFDACALRNHNNLREDADQLEAMDTIFQSPITIVQGPAGSGKTSILQRIRGISGITMLILVPTHQVRQTITEKIRPAMTIARLLQDVRSDPSGQWKKRYQFVQTVAIDEAGLVSEAEFCELVPIFCEFVSLTRIVITGDDRQLPPIMGGAMLHDLQGLEFVRVCTLRANHRARNLDTKENGDNLVKFQDVYWSQAPNKWQQAEKMLLGQSITPVASEILSFALSSEDLVKRLETIKAQTASLISPLLLEPKHPQGTDVIPGLRLHWMSPLREQSLYDYMYTCMRGRFGSPGSVKCLTFKNNRRIQINQELLKRHLDTIAPGTLSKTASPPPLDVKHMGLVVGAPYQCRKQDFVQVLASVKQTQSDKPWLESTCLYVNDMLWVHEIREVTAPWVKRRYKDMGNPHRLICTNASQTVRSQHGTFMSLQTYLSKHRRVLVARMSPDPPPMYEKEAKEWVRPAAPTLETMTTWNKPKPVTGLAPALASSSSLASPRRTSSMDWKARLDLTRRSSLGAGGAVSLAPSTPTSPPPPPPLSSSLVPSKRSDPGRWFLVNERLLNILDYSFCQTIDSMQGSERDDIHFVCDSCCSSERIKVALSRVKRHCDVYLMPREKGPVASVSNWGQEHQYAAYTLIERLKQQTPPRLTAMEVISSFLFALTSKSLQQQV